MTVKTYTELIWERKCLMAHAPLMTGHALNETRNRVRDIDVLLREADAALPRWTGYQSAISNNIMEVVEIHAICTDLIIKSWWASWLPFEWMHNLAASYYAGKARRIYNAKKAANELVKLNGYRQSINSRSTSIPE
jgi:hypothetical protein